MAAGTYTITVRICCKETNRCVSASITLVICPKPNPAFTMSSNGTGVTLTTVAAGCKDYWYLVKDNDKNCQYSAGDTYTFQSGNPANFTGLVMGQQYIVYHIVGCTCDGKHYCYAWERMCFTWFAPNTRIPTGTPQPTTQKETVSIFKGLPSDLLRGLPQEVQNADHKD